MSNLIIKSCSFFLIFLLLCACNAQENQSSLSENNSAESSVVESMPEESFVSESNKQPYSDELFFACEIPAFTDADRTKLPYSEISWCTDGSSVPQSHKHEQLFVKDETAAELAAAISLIDGDKLRHLSDFKDFENISEASNEYMIFAALNSTPYVIPGSGENSDNIVSLIADYFYNSIDAFIDRVYYAEDAEKTFHYLFGDEAEFNPVNIPGARYRYSSEESIFFSEEDNYLYSYSFPQIISYREENGKYYVEAVMLIPFDYDNSGNVSEELSEDDILKKQHTSYTFEKAKDGHFVILSISTAE